MLFLRHYVRLNVNSMDVKEAKALPLATLNLAPRQVTKSWFYVNDFEGRMWPRLPVTGIERKL